MDKPATRSATPTPDLSTVGPLGIDNGDHPIKKSELVALLVCLFPGLSVNDVSAAIDRAGGR